ncbi:aKG-HExxH-type peptide beta-hydroxylase [Actinocorallia herbida]|uniref:aKG-HExxH-type peptide beta-hydroxylase n=1 Tax=Actinocorallia herbida TaxID=58109 RepID=UPI001FE3D3C4|nr:HEXXH motif-containing putative peptide modification protein [Actinocorallia herbida]
MAADQDTRVRLLLWGVHRRHPMPCAYGLLEDLEARHPEPAAVVLRYPPVRAWARAALLGHAPPEFLGNIAAAVAVRCGEDGPGPADGMPLELPSLGKAADDRPAGEWAVRKGAVTVGGEELDLDGPGWRALGRAGVAGADILLDDIAAHRTPGLPPGSFGGRRRQWERLLGEAGGVLLRRHWSVAAELRALVRSIAPLPGPGQRHATVPGAFGCVAMTLPPDPVAAAMTLAHEVQHAKMAALQAEVPLVRPDHQELFYAPWRRDPRPALGLLHGAYAHLGVTGFWRRQRAAQDGTHAHVQFVRWRDSTLTACADLLAAGCLTEAGDFFVRTMRGSLTSWLDEPVPDRARRLAREQTLGHRLRWQEEHR